MVGGTPCALWLLGNFSCDCMFWENSGGGRTTQPVGTATMTGTSANHVDLGSFSSRCWTFRRTHTIGTRTDWVLKGEEGGMMTPLLQYVARFDRGRLQEELVMVLPVCRIPVSICCAKR